MYEEKLYPIRYLVIGAGLALSLAFYLLRDECLVFLVWWLLMLLLGIGFLPLARILFSGFSDLGWLFSKVLGTIVCGYLTWVLCVGNILPFTSAACMGVTVLCLAGNLVLEWFQGKKRKDQVTKEQLSLICWEELCFFCLFLLWTYLAGFRPAAYGTEKFMDYGFMEAMMRSTVLPAKDMWYAQAPINYYYGGQYFATFLTKLSGTRVEETYNLMRTLVAAFAFVLPCALVRQLCEDRLGDRTKGKGFVAWLFGLLGGGAVSLAGNLHYLVYAKILPLLQKTGFLGGEADSYWFPDATRYIGHNPETADHTIHEFPCYSFVLGDLHAHVVNLMFVLFVIGLLYAWQKQARGDQKEVCYPNWIAFFKGELLQPRLLLIGGILGMFQWTNFWDFVMYYVVTGGVVLFVNVTRHGHRPGKVLLATVLEAVEVMLLAVITAYPFTSAFETMVQGVALCQNHSRFYQLVVLWGLPFVVVIVFLLVLFWGKWKKPIWKNLEEMAAADLFVLVLSLCAMGLVLIPEIVYVRDIYEETSARANTMFKLTYQAFTMFGIAMAYSLFRLLFLCKRKAVKFGGLFLLLLLLSTFGYFGNAVHSWFGQVWKPAEYKGLDATSFLEEDFWEDAGAIRWLKENIEGSPVVLEANGDSYSDYERVSAMTGLPTVMGWYVHEWLWRGDVSDLNEKSEEIQTIYTSADTEQVTALLEKYAVSYIFVGSMEREKYENLQEAAIRSLGEVVYEDDVSHTFILRVAEKSGR